MIRFEQTVDVGSQHTLVEIPDDVDMDQFAMTVRQFALALGFHPDTVKEYLGEA